MAIYTKAIGKTVTCMAVAFLSFQTAICMTEIGKTITCMAAVFLSMLMAVVTKVSGKTINRMAPVSSLTLKELPKFKFTKKEKLKKSSDYDFKIKNLKSPLILY